MTTTSTTTATATKERFDALADRWEAHVRDVSSSSDPRVYVRHEAFDAIVAMGEDVLPLVVDRYRVGTLFWGAVLTRITGDASKGDGVTGDLKATKRAWLAWWDARPTTA